MMNVIQYWLIDSIVKANDGDWSHSRIDSGALSSSEADHEPLFHASDDDDDDALRTRPDDAEAQRRPSDRSGASSFHIFLFRSHSIWPTTAHDYPPNQPPIRLTPSPHSVRSTSPTEPLGTRRKQSLPAPLLPRSPMVPAINSPDPTAPNQKAIGNPKHVTNPHEGSTWETWVDEDDWADKVGEEDWTGRRLETRRANVDSAWT
jgi:hypothetical protein